MIVSSGTALHQPLDADAKQPVTAAVDRAMGELRRGAPVLVTAPGGSPPRAMIAAAAEGASAELIARMAALAGTQPSLAVTARRARVLGLMASAGGAAGGVAGGVMVLSCAAGLAPDGVRMLADPSRRGEAALLARLTARPAGERTEEAAAVALAKLARLLPATLVAPIPADDPSADPRAWALAHDVQPVPAADILDYQVRTARSLRRVAEARVPLVKAENARIVAFRPSDGGLEHLAIVIGEPDPAQPVLVRLHSECFTGDLLGSLRCDCGDQLRGAIAEIARQGSGIVLYLSQEGRGIGLVNKLRAYTLQDQGFDTVDANEMLGFDADERVYLPAVEMLRLMGIARVRLMTNNPEKLGQLAHLGIEVVERVPHIFPSNDHNAAYLQTKAQRSGHLF